MCKFPSILELLKVAASSPRDRLLQRRPRIKIVFAVSASHANQYRVHLPLQCYCFACFSLTSLMYRAVFIKIPLTAHFRVWIPFSLSWFSNLLNPVALCLSPHWCFVTSFNLELSLRLISALWTLSFRLLMKMLNACKTSSNNGPCCTWLNNLLQLHKLL